MRGRILGPALRQGFLAALLILLLGHPTATRTADRNQALALVRLINAAESTYRENQGRYGAFGELVWSGQLARAAKASPENERAYRALHLQSSGEPGREYTVRLLVSSNGAAYQLSLSLAADGCGSTLFSDERGMTYEGKALGCAPAAASPFLASVPADIDDQVPPVRADMPCPMEHLLHETGLRAEELVDNLQRFSASDHVDDAELNKDGRARPPTRGKFNYVAEINHATFGPYVVEYRDSASDGLVPESHWADTGTAAFALIFHPRYLPDYAVTCEGLGEIKGRSAWQVRFAQRPERGNAFHVYRVANNSYAARLKGRAWISPDKFEVLRIETDLLEPIEAIRLQREHSIVEYGPVGFSKQKVQLWLPQVAELYIDHRGRRYLRRHSFRDFQLFWVDTDQQIKEPPVPKEQH